jgi:hypothetical protein
VSDELRDVLLSELWGLAAADAGSGRHAAGLQWWRATVGAVHRVLRDLFRGAAPSVGSWPLSRAYYAVDVILDTDTDIQTDTHTDTAPAVTVAACSAGGAGAGAASESAAAAEQSAVGSASLNGEQADSVHDISLSLSEVSVSVPVSVPAPVPKLMEVNYMGDWRGMAAALRAGRGRGPLAGQPVGPPSALGEYVYGDWCKDILVALMTAKSLDTNIFTQL